MSTILPLQQWREAGISLRAEAGELLVTAPQRQFTDSFKQGLRQHKAAIIQQLQAEATSENRHNIEELLYHYHERVAIMTESGARQSEAHETALKEVGAAFSITCKSTDNASAPYRRKAATSDASPKYPPAP